MLADALIGDGIAMLRIPDALMSFVMQAAIAGVMRGLGWQKTVAWLNLLGFWVIGLSAGASLTFGAGIGVAGLWWGFAMGLTCVALLGVTIVLRIDWEREVRFAQQRVGTLAAHDAASSTDTAAPGRQWKEMAEVTSDDVLPGDEGEQRAVVRVDRG